jgi:hypothetical protein
VSAVPSFLPATVVALADCRKQRASVHSNSILNLLALGPDTVAGAVLTGTPSPIDMYYKDKSPMGAREDSWSKWFGVACLGQAAILNSMDGEQSTLRPH